MPTRPEAGGGKTWQRNAIRVALVAFTCGIAQVKEFGIITNIVGGLAMCTLGFVVPPIMLMRLNTMPKWRRDSEHDSVQASAAGPSHTVVVGQGQGPDSLGVGFGVNAPGSGRRDSPTKALLGPGKGAGVVPESPDDAYVPLPPAGSLGALAEALPMWEYVACGLLVCFGVVAAVSTTYVSVHDLVT